MVKKKVLGFFNRVNATDPMDVEMGYDPSSPLEVNFTFDDSVTWTFGRDLLIIGCVKATGEGDVRISPAPDDMVRLTLDSPFGHAEIDLSRTDIASFLNDTFLEFPQYREEEFVAEALTEWFEKEMGAAE